MASRKFEKNSEEWQIFTEYWKLCQQYWEIEDNDEYWKHAIEAVDRFYKKYKGENEFFAKKLAIAFTDTLSEKEKKRQKH